MLCQCSPVRPLTQLFDGFSLQQMCTYAVDWIMATVRDMLIMLKDVEWHIATFHQQGIQFSWNVTTHYTPLYAVLVNLSEALVHFSKSKGCLLTGEELYRVEAVTHYPPRTIEGLLNSLRIILKVLEDKYQSNEISTALLLWTLSLSRNIIFQEWLQTGWNQLFAVTFCSWAKMIGSWWMRPSTFQVKVISDLSDRLLETIHSLWLKVH